MPSWKPTVSMKELNCAGVWFVDLFVRYEWSDTNIRIQAKGSLFLVLMRMYSCVKAGLLFVLMQKMS